MREIIFSKLPLINTTYACRCQSNRFKWFVNFVYFPIHYCLTVNYNTNLSVPDGTL